MIIQQIRSGWPDDKRHVPIEIKEYFPYRHELSEHEGLVYKAHNVLIPLLTPCYMLCSISFNVAQLLQYTRLNIASVHRLFVLDIM